MIQARIHKKGFSLIELMSALALTSIVMVGIYTMYFTLTKSHATQIEPGSGKNYKRHFYRVDSNANRTQDIEAVVCKVYKTGYN